MTTKSLAGCRILITRSPRQAPALAKRIEELGGIAVTIPLIKTIPLTRQWQLQVNELKNVSSYDWIVFTSVNAVNFFKKALTESGMTIHPDTRIAAIGSKTAKALENEGWHPDLIPDSYVAEELVSVLKKQVQTEEKVLLPKSELARNVIPETLSEMGIEVVEMPLYTSAPYREKKQVLQAVMEEKHFDVLTFTSPSIVRAFYEFMKNTHVSPFWETIPAVCIGPITEEEAIKKGFKNRYTASPHTIEGMLDELKKICHRKVTYQKEENNERLF